MAHAHVTSVPLDNQQSLIFPRNSKVREPNERAVPRVHAGGNFRARARGSLALVAWYKVYTLFYIRIYFIRIPRPKFAKF